MLKTKNLIFIILVSFMISGFLYLFYNDSCECMGARVKDKYYPGEWFHFQRSFPQTDIPYDKYLEAVDKKNQMQTDNPNPALTWNPSGPFNVGGRITALAVDPSSPNIIIIGAAAGGVFKTTNGGTNWMPKTDNSVSLSVGAMEMDPNNSNIIYCGTGEANASTDSYAGFGLLKSTNKGDSWFLSGLDSSRHIGAISVHPLNSSLIFAAVSGGLYSKNTYRGVYKSTNAGVNWQRVLYISDSTSAIDVAVDPSDVNIVYAAMWERLRGPTFRRAAGFTSGLYKSTNSGTTWVRLSNGLPAPAADIGRISVAVSKSNSNFVYTLYKKTTNPGSPSHNNEFEGFYKSSDKGNTWTRMPDGILPSEFSSFGWYFGLIKVDPVNSNIVYVGDVDLLRTTNGGTSWTNITESYSGTFEQQHPDQHPLWINPANTVNMIVGNDGGLFKTVNNGTNWTKSYDLPISQSYASTIDYLLPQRKYTGTQDNGTVGTQTGGTVDWDYFYGGDGFYCLVDYTNSSIIYAESQYGNIGRSTNNGNSFQNITSGLDLTRTNWSTPFVMDVQDPSTIYLGSYKLFRTTNRGSSWSAVSPDLTRGPNGRLGTITCVTSAVLPNNQRVFYVGTDDWKVSVSTNSGGNWTDVTGTLPQRYVTDVLADKRNPNIAYVTLSGYNLDEDNAHIFRTTNYGANWINISSNMPNIPVNSLIIDYNRDSLLYVGCDVGVFYSNNLGQSWNVLSSGLPNAPVSDLNYHQPTKTLVAATHGRSMFEVDVSELVGIENLISNVAKEFKLYQNYPNPFNPLTKIKLDIPANSFVNLTIYDVSGRLTEVLLNKEMRTGHYEVDWDAGKYSSGVYFYVLESVGFRETKKMILVK